MMTVQISVALVLGAVVLALALVAGTGAIGQLGLQPILGNREPPLATRGWVGRGLRAQENLLQNLLPFAVVAFALQAVGANSALSETAALVFLAARLGHALVYIAGIPGLRTLLYNVGVLATFVTAAPLLGRLMF